MTTDTTSGLRRKHRQRRFHFQEAARLYLRSAYACHCAHYYAHLVDRQAARLALLGDDISRMDVPYWPRHTPLDGPVTNPGRDWSRYLDDMLSPGFQGVRRRSASWRRWIRGK